MRAVLTLTSLAAASLLAAGSAAAASGTPKSPLAAYGYHLYGEYCLSCHGANAAGRYHEPSTATGAGPGRAQGQQGGIGPSLDGVGALAADFYLRTGYMPLRQIGLQPRREPVILGEHQIRALVAYVATFGGPPIPTPQPARGSLSQGLSLFTEHCAGCHQIDVQGGYVTNAVAPRLTQASPVEIAEAVRTGPYLMPRFSGKQISDEQLDSLIRYVLYAKHPDDRGGWALGHVGPVPEGLVAWFVGIVLLIATCAVIGKRIES